jgi:hypothetical protein
MKSCLVTIAFILMGLNALALARSEANRSMPRFDRQNENVTAVIGSNAVIPCYVNNLGDHKVISFLIIFNKNKIFHSLAIISK